tara:strand:- start:8765 stop:9085 length:321 start_codon:yes stop_codon:yes gene_type:complete
MRSNVVKFDKLDLTNEIESNSINLSQKQSLNKMILDKLSVILGQDINKGLKMLEQFTSKEEMVTFRSELETQISSKQKVAYQSISNNGRLNNLKSCFEGLPADSIL